MWLQSDVARTGNVARLEAKPLIDAATKVGVKIDRDCVPVEHRVATITIDRKTGVVRKRKLFPVVQASVATVHKSRGATYADVVYEYNRKQPQKLIYIAFSRCTDVHLLFLTDAKGDQKFCYGNENIDL